MKMRSECNLDRPASGVVKSVWRAQAPLKAKVSTWRLLWDRLRC